VDATPIEGTVVVNAGDLLARWSNDTIKSTIHRVVEPPTKSDKYPARYSIAYVVQIRGCRWEFDMLTGHADTFATPTSRAISRPFLGRTRLRRRRSTRASTVGITLCSGWRLHIELFFMNFMFRMSRL
jgi:hypothetical protein